MNTQMKMLFCVAVAVAAAIMVLAADTTHAKKGGGGGPKETEIYFDVVVLDQEGPSIQSDFGGPYMHGVDNVVALYGRHGGRFVTEARIKGKGSPGLHRKVDMTFSGDVDYPYGLPEGTIPIDDHYTVSIRFDSEVDPLDMDVDLYPEYPTFCSILVFFEFHGDNWLISYDMDAPFESEDGTIIRETENTWRVDGTKARLGRDSPPTSLRSDKFDLPISFTLTTIPEP